MPGRGGRACGAALAAPSADLAQVESHLAATQSMTAGFIQTDGKDRSLKGTLALKRPGRIRFDYGAAPTCCWSATARR